MNAQWSLGKRNDKNLNFGQTSEMAVKSGENTNDVRTAPTNDGTEFSYTAHYLKTTWESFAEQAEAELDEMQKEIELNDTGDSFEDDLKYSEMQVKRAETVEKYLGHIETEDPVLREALSRDGIEEVQHDEIVTNIHKAIKGVSGKFKLGETVVKETIEAEVKVGKQQMDKEREEGAFFQGDFAEETGITPRQNLGFIDFVKRQEQFERANSGFLETSMSDKKRAMIDSSSKCLEGIMASTPPNFCWKGFDIGSTDEMRCKDGWYRAGLFCRKSCRDNHFYRLLMCWENCDRGWTDAGLFCFKIKYAWFIPYPDFSSRNIYVPDYVTLFSDIAVCTTGHVKWGFLCYDDCGHHHGMYNCGPFACSLDPSQCKSQIISSAINVFFGVLDAVAFVLSFGASSAINAGSKALNKLA